MNKNRIRLSESQLHRVIKESVKKVLKEMENGNNIFYVPCGEEFLHELIYNGPHYRHAVIGMRNLGTLIDALYAKRDIIRRERQVYIIKGEQFENSNSDTVLIDAKRFRPLLISSDYGKTWMSVEDIKKERKNRINNYYDGNE